MNTGAHELMRTLRKFRNFFILITMTGCSRSYYYYPPPVHYSSFANIKEAHLSGSAGTGGTSVYGQYAVGNDVSVAAGEHGAEIASYKANETEVAIILKVRDSVPVKFNMLIGYGTGSNYDLDSGAILKDFRGRINKPFIAFSISTARTKPILGKRISSDKSFTVKINYLVYNGYRTTVQNKAVVEKEFEAQNFFFEPYFNYNIGTRHLRFCFGLGASFKKKYRYDRNLTVFPLDIQLGLMWMPGRKFESRKLSEFLK